MSSEMLWYLRRLRAMSPPEVWYRLRQRLIAEWERLGEPVGRMAALEPQLLAEAWGNFRAEKSAHFFFQWDRRNEIVRQYEQEFPPNWAATFQVASELLEHKFRIFGQKFTLGPRIAWHTDPLTKREWPQSHWIDIDIRAADTVGGVKWVWELNRHHHLVTLGKAYFLSGDEKFAEEVCAQLEDWILTNPPYIGVNWTSSLELAIRLINWTFALAFIRGSSVLRENLFGLILHSIVIQAEYISRHLSAYSSANNHLIGEAAGLAIVGLAFPWLPQARFWRNKGFTILRREVVRQIYPDGVPCEQSIHYLAFVVDFNLLAWRLAELNGFQAPQVWYERLSAACDFIQHLMDDRGNVPAIGDSDDGWVVRLDDREEVNNYRSILATASVLLQRSDFKSKAEQWDEKSHWLFGEQGRRLFEALPRTGGEVGSHIFREGGYCVMRHSGRVIVFDCGPLGYLSTAAHGHADALSVIASISGKPLLIDPGTYAYHEGGYKRDYFRSTAAHNTVVVDGKSQSQMLGTFLWGHKARAQMLRWESTSEYDLAIAEHDGYKRIGVIHRRTLLFRKPNWLLIVDDLNGKGKHIIEQFWHMSPGIRLLVKSTYCLALLEESGEVLPILFLEGTPGCCVKVYVAEEEPTQGWFSPQYGQIRPAPVLSVSVNSTLPVRLVTAFYLSAVPLAAIDEASLAHLKVEAGEITRSLLGGA